MAYPGIVLFFGVGIGIALLYYVFSDNAHERSHAYSGNTRSPSSYDNWISDRDRSGRARDRRDSSGSLRSREGRDTCKDDINCSICQESLCGAEVSRLIPCNHYFHSSCINTLRKYNAEAVCPNCRRNISQVL